MRANFTPRTQEIIALAKKLAKKFSHSKVDLEHLLLALLKVDSFILPYISGKLNIDFSILEDQIEKVLSYMSVGQQSSSSVTFSTNFKSCLDFSYSLSLQKQHAYISVEHVLYAMLNDLNSNIIDYFIGCDFDVVEIQDILDLLLNKDVINDTSVLEEETEQSFFSTHPQSSSSSFIEQYSTNLNDLAASGKFDFLSPNLSYISKMEETLCRKTKSCALLVGDPGVGKTALVEALAHKIVKLESNDYLISKQILSIDLSAMVAGTKYRGQFEERLKFFIDEVIDAKNKILFIDEIHTIVGAGNSEGALDAANILKPYIARGEITCIGSTTYEEYKKSFSKDPALKRRFALIKIDEPTPKEAEKILIDVAPSYANFHGISYDVEAIKAAVSLSSKYINDRKLPDKAIDLIDQAGAMVKIKHYKKPKKAKKMEHALLDEDITLDVKNSIYEDYKKIMNKWGNTKFKKPAIVKPKDIKTLISNKLEIPIESINETSSDILLNLEARMNRTVIGQSEAISQVTNALFKTHCGLKDDSRPIGSFLFLGKTGVGKTLMSKSLAQHYFGSYKKLIYFDMSEFSESNSVSKFSGSSPGYIGYDKGGILTEKIKRNPHCVLLFDEIEKAHPDVLQSFLQIMEEGRMTDNSGEEVSFKNVIIIFTSNLGADIIDTNGSMGFLPKSSSRRDKILQEAQRRLSPELVNRFDGIVLFNNFSESELNKIITIELGKVRKKLQLKNIKINFTHSLKKYILNKTVSENLGGRPIRRIIQNEVEVELAKYIIYNTCESVTISYKEEKLYCYASPSPTQSKS